MTTGRINQVTILLARWRRRHWGRTPRGGGRARERSRGLAQEFSLSYLAAPPWRAGAEGGGPAAARGGAIPPEARGAGGPLGDHHLASAERSLGTGPPQEPRRLPLDGKRAQAADDMRTLGGGVPARRVTRFRRRGRPLRGEPG